MFSISFLTPVLITLGCISALIPILIHFSIQKKPKKQLLPTLRFLQKTKITGHFFRIKQWVLLLLRMALLVGFSMVLARPKLASTWFSGTAFTHVTNAIILLDDTLSMNYKESGNLRFEQAKAKALEILEQLEPPSKVCLYPVTQGPGEFTIDFESIRADIQRLVCSSEHQSIQSALLQAKTLLEELKEDGEIFVFSDFRANNFEDLTTLVNSLPKTWQGIKVHLESVIKEESANAGILELNLPIEPIPVGGTLHFSCKILTQGNASVERDISLYLDSEKKSQKRLHFLPGQSVSEVEFTQKITQTGIFHGKVILEGEDAFNADNSYYFTLRTLEPFHIGILAEASQYEALQPAFLLENILKPRGVHFEQQFLIQSLTPETFFQRDLKNIDLLFLLTLPREGESAINRLKEILEMEGSLIFFAQKDPLLSPFIPPVGEMLPGPVSLESSGRGFLLPFKTGKYGNLAQPLFSQYRQVQLQESGTQPLTATSSNNLSALTGPEVLISFQNGAPAVIQKKMGLGQILYLTFALQIEPKSLATTPVVVPFFHFLVRSLLSKGSSPLHAVGSQNVALKLRKEELGGEVKILRPNENKMEKLTLPSGTDLLLMDQINLPGHYDIFIKGQNELRKEGFSVNVSEAEKDFRPSDLAKLKRIFEDLSTHSKKEADPSNTMGRVREKEVFAYLLLVLLLLLSIESLLSNRI
ncbi:MAG: BatA domain-containing protein [Planctomycetota bacterium]